MTEQSNQNDDEPIHNEGDLAYDVAKQTLVSVISADEGTVDEQDPAMKDLIKKADGNKAVGFDTDTRCVEIAYVGVDEGSRTYTMPETRVKSSPKLITAVREVTTDVGSDFAEDVDDRLRLNKALTEFYDER